MVVLNHLVLPLLRLTAEEYLQTDLPEGHRYELVDGVVQISQSHDPWRDGMVGAAYFAVYEYRLAHPELVGHLSQRASVVVPRQGTIRHPDLAVYPIGEPENRGWAGWLNYVPLLVMEVTSADRAVESYWQKRKDYWKAKVREYWIIDPDACKATVLARGEKCWQETVFTPDQQAASQALQGFTVAVAGLIA
jgi:Uma2 family endonuclease